MDYEKLITEIMKEVQDFNIGLLEKYKEHDDIVGFALWGGGIIARRYLEGMFGKEFVHEKEQEIEATFAVNDLMNSVKQ